MLIRTFVCGGTLVPACGRWETTVFFGWLEGTTNGAGTRLAAFSTETAADRVWPTTFGTRVAPRETRIATVEPFATEAPEAGLWLITTPAALDEATLIVCAERPSARSARIAAGALSPTTSGTVTCAVEEAERVTTVPRVTCVPGPGSSAKIVPAGSELGLATTREVRPARPRRSTAGPCFCPITFGTVTLPALLWSSPRVKSQSAISPAATSSRSRSSQGQRSGGRPRGGGGGGGSAISSSTTGGGPGTSSCTSVSVLPSDTGTAAGPRRKRESSLIGGLGTPAVLKESLQFAHGALIRAAYRHRGQPRGGIGMARKLIVLGLAALLGLAIAGVANARWFNVIRGTRNADVLIGTDSRDLVLAFAGDDQVSPGGGGDIVYAGRGNDSVDGGFGFDRIFGGPDNDTIVAGDGGSIVWGGAGNDTITGGTGRNWLHGGLGDDTVTGGPLRDRLWVGAGVDTENGGDGNDVLHALFPDGQVDRLDCGPGDHDVAWIRQGEPDVVVNCEVVKTLPPTAH